MSWFCGCVNFFCGGWCAVSVKAVAWVLDDLQGLKPGPTLVMLALADFADERNSCFPGQKTLAARARCSKRSVINYLKELQDLGLLSVETRFYSNGDSGIRRSSNRYILHVGRTFSLEDANSAPSRKTTGHAEGANSAPSGLESAKLPVSKVQQVAPIEPPVIEPPVPPSIPPNYQDIGSSDEFLGEGSASPPGAPPVGGAGGEKISSFGFSPSAAQNESASDVRSSGSLVGVITSPEATSVAGGESRRGATLHPSSADVELVCEVLPERMQAIPLRDYSKVAAAIRQRLEAGYSRKQITAILAARCLPDRIRHLTALVMARFRDDLPVNMPPPAASNGGRVEWSHVLSDGRVVTRKDLDFGLLAIDFRSAQRSGDPRATSGDRLKFAVDQGIEKYII